MCLAAIGRSRSLLGRAPKLSARIHYSSRHFSTALENTALAICFHTLRVKSLLGLARQPLGARNHCSGVLRSHLASEIAAHEASLSWTQLESTQPQGARRHCSGVLRSHSALQRFMVFESSFSHSQSPSKSLCFELCVAPSCVFCDSTGTIRCHART